MLLLVQQKRRIRPLTRFKSRAIGRYSATRRSSVNRFLHRERNGEEPYFGRWFSEHGFTVHELPSDLPFEGAGDALLHRDGRTMWAGYGFRSELEAHPFLAKTLDLVVRQLKNFRVLADRRYGKGLLRRLNLQRGNNFVHSFGFRRNLDGLVDFLL